MSEEWVRPDATTLRGIAHPLRVKMLTLLREDGPATATMLAERLGQSTGATSYHLRQLAQYGFVVDEPALGAGRERWWKAAHRGTNLERDRVREAPAETEAYLRAVASLYADRMDRWLSEHPALGDEWAKTYTLSDQRLRLTPDEARKLRRELGALIERYRRDDPDVPAPPDAERIVAQWQLMPFLHTEKERPAVGPTEPPAVGPTERPAAGSAERPAAGPAGGTADGERS